MLRQIAIFVTGVLIGGLAGSAFGLAAYPFVFPPPVANERLATDELTAIVARGRFVPLSSANPLRNGSGGVTVLQRTVFLESDFDVAPGPGYHVYLVPRSPIRRSAEVKETDFIDLGRLRAFKGSQKYSVPATVKLTDYPTVVVWSATFGLLIAPADLEFL